MATVLYDGREINMDDVIAGDDDFLKQALLPHLGPEIANATIKRERKEGQMKVSLLKKAGTKGATPPEGLLAALMGAQEQINPVFVLALTLKRAEERGTLGLDDIEGMQPQIEEALETGAREHGHTSEAVRLLKAAPATAARGIVVGF